MGMYIKGESVPFFWIRDIIILSSVWCWMQQCSTVHVNIVLHLYMKVSSRSTRICLNLKEYDTVSTVVNNNCLSLLADVQWSNRFLVSSFKFHLLSFHRSIQDYKIHMDMEIVIFLTKRGETNPEVYSNRMVQYGIWGFIPIKII